MRKGKSQQQQLVKSYSPAKEVLRGQVTETEEVQD